MGAFTTCAGCGSLTDGAYRCLGCRDPADADRSVALPIRHVSQHGERRNGRRVGQLAGVLAVLAAAGIGLQLTVSRAGSTPTVISRAQAGAHIEAFFRQHGRTATSVTCVRGPIRRGTAPELCQASVDGVVEDITVVPTGRTGTYRLALTGTR